VLIGDDNFLMGFKLIKNQVQAMALKKFLFTLRNYKLFIIQFIIPIIFLIITMLLEHSFGGSDNLPALPISLDEYFSTINVATLGEIEPDPFVNITFEGYKSFFAEEPSDERVLSVVSGDFQDYILGQTLSSVNLKYMTGVTFSGSDIIAWFNNQGYHTAPLTINIINNAILKGFLKNSSIHVVNKPLPFQSGSRVKKNKQINFRIKTFIKYFLR
jgi:ATP-binding cassette, subfamily A (ABC1), member 3